MSVPNGNDIHQRSFQCCGITTGSPKMNLFQIIDPLLWIVTNISSSIWPLLQAEFTASPSPLLCLVHSLAWLRCAPCGWISHALLIECLSLTEAGSVDLSFSAKWEEEEGGFISFLWETLLTERTIRPVCHWHSKELFCIEAWENERQDCSDRWEKMISFGKKM